MKLIPAILFLLIRTLRDESKILNIFTEGAILFYKQNHKKFRRTKFDGSGVVQEFLSYRSVRKMSM